MKILLDISNRVPFRCFRLFPREESIIGFRLEKVVLFVFACEKTIPLLVNVGDGFFGNGVIFEHAKAGRA